MNKIIYACDIGGSKLLCGFVDTQGKIIDTEKVALHPEITVQELEDHIVMLYRQLCERNPQVQPVACGMTIPGLADSKIGMWVYACFSGISDYPIVESMQPKLGLPIAIANDVNACALAEKMFGNAKDCDDYLWVTVSNGVGGGLVLNGKIFEGAWGGAGEIGHLIVEQNGLLCPCGHRGCLEAMAAGPAIAKRYVIKTGMSTNAAEIADLARKGDPQAKAIMEETGMYIGRGLGRAASLLNLKRYIVGGGVMQSLDLMKDAMYKAFYEEAFERPNAKVEIVPTALHYEAGLLGATAVAVASANS